MASPSSFPNIPKFGHNHQRMLYIQVFDDGSYQTVDRSTFFSLLHTVDHPQEQVVLDLEGALVYIVPPSEEMATAAVEFARDADRQKKQYNRHHRCVYYGTVKCDSWKKDVEGHRGCDSCTRTRTRKTISLDALVADTHAVATDTPIDQRLYDEYNHKILRLALATLSPANRQFIQDRYREGMTFTQLAEKYGLKDRNYASKKAWRIITRLRQTMEKYC